MSTRFCSTPSPPHNCAKWHSLQNVISYISSFVTSLQSRGNRSCHHPPRSTSVFLLRSQKLCLRPHCSGTTWLELGPRPLASGSGPLPGITAPCFDKPSWQCWGSPGLGSLCHIPGERGKQPGWGRWRGATFSQVLEPHSHTSLIPSLPNSSVVFSCGFFSNPDPGS